MLQVLCFALNLDILNPDINVAREWLRNYLNIEMMLIFQFLNFLLFRAFFLFFFFVIAKCRDIFQTFISVMSQNFYKCLGDENVS